MPTTYPEAAKRVADKLMRNHRDQYCSCMSNTTTCGYHRLDVIEGGTYERAHKAMAIALAACISYTKDPRQVCEDYGILQVSLEGGE